MVGDVLGTPALEGVTSKGADEDITWSKLLHDMHQPLSL